MADRVTSSFVEVLNTGEGSSTPKSRVTASFAEVLHTAQGSISPMARVTSLFVEVLSEVNPMPKGPPLALFPTPILTSTRGVAGLVRRL